MNARLKLNTAYIQGAILFAALVGWLFDSWLIFVMVTGLLVAMSAYSGEIRVSPQPRYRKVTDRR